MLNQIFLPLIALFAYGELRETERILFKDNSLNNLNIPRNIFGEPPRTWAGRNDESITFVEDSDRKNGSDKWVPAPNYNLNTDIYGVNSHAGHTFIKKNGSDSGYVTDSNSYGNSNNGPGENSWTQSNTDENNYSNSYASDRNGSFPWNSANNTGSGSDRNGSSEGNARRKLLPENSCGVDLPRRILGGTTADIDEFPWLALLQYRDRTGKISHDCGGALISSRYVVTAAHCAVGLGVTTRKLKLEKVRLGEWDLSTDNDCQQEICNRNLQDIEIEEIMSHPKYSPRQTSQTNDIALLRLRREAEMNQFVQPICLPLDSVANRNFEGKKLSVAGWGKTSNERNSKSNIKMKVEVPVVGWDTCRSFYESFYDDVKIEKSQMCAGGEEGKDSCQGDSGGPLMSIENTQPDFRWFIVGVVSSGPAACGVEGRPSLYTRVSDFTDWILDSIRD